MPMTGGWSDVCKLVTAKRFPSVVYRVDVRGAAWFGRYAFLGANPVGKVSFATEREACEALESLGWIRRPASEDTTLPHYDEPSK